MLIDVGGSPELPIADRWTRIVRPSGRSTSVRTDTPKMLAERFMIVLVMLSRFLLTTVGYEHENQRRSICDCLVCLNR